MKIGRVNLDRLQHFQGLKTFESFSNSNFNRFKATENFELVSLKKFLNKSSLHLTLEPPKRVNPLLMVPKRALDPKI